MDTTIKLFCLIGNETSLRAFEIEIDSTATVSKLKDIDAYKLTLWLVEIPEDKEGFAITLESKRHRDEDSAARYLKHFKPSGTVGEAYRKYVYYAEQSGTKYIFQCWRREQHC
ncbi:hypothetical protein DFQ30_000602 [Apophysomyces sp. BC1015]|nr:hypothetical protein DFQ30_000602 [Apophysomyces sp. BC1015]